MAPKKSIIKDYMEPVYTDNVLTHKKCTFCNHLRSANQHQATKWAKHFIKCTQCPMEVKELIYKDHNSAQEVRDAWAKMLGKQEQKAVPGVISRGSTSSDVSSPSLGTAIQEIRQGSTSSHFTSSISSQTSKKPRTVGPLDQFGDHCDEDRCAEISRAITEFVVENGLAFNIIDSPSFKNLLKVLNAAYPANLRTAKTFMRTELPKLHNKTKQDLMRQMDEITESDYYTLGIDGFVNETGSHVYIITQAKGDKVMFLDCVPEAERSQNADAIRDIIEAQLLAVAKDRPVESVFAGVVFDNTKVMPAAGEKVLEKFPKLFLSGCRAHAADLLMEDIAKVPVIKEVVDRCLDIAKFVKGHRMVRAAYERIMKDVPGATRQKTFPITRFAYCDKTLEHVVGKKLANLQVMQNMVSEENWQTTCSGVAGNKAEIFKETIMSDKFREQIEAVRLLTQPISVFIHHLERPGARASWVIPLFDALKKTLSKWQNTLSVKSALSADTCNLVVEAFLRRYKGDNRMEPIYRKELLLAMILDHFTCPVPEELDQIEPEWRNHCKEIFTSFHKDDPGKAALVHQDFMKLMISVERGRGLFGENVESSSDLIQSRAREANKQLEFKTELAYEVNLQKEMLAFAPAVAWCYEYKPLFPHLSEIAARLLPLAIQSADVERCCKVNKLVHTKIRNRLGERNVSMLLSCYINLRLLRSMVKNPFDYDKLEGGLLSETTCEALEEEE